MVSVQILSTHVSNGEIAQPDPYKWLLAKHLRPLRLFVQAGSACNDYVHLKAGVSKRYLSAR